MTPLREWLKPPRTLLLTLFLLALVSVSTLAWFGWRLREQEQLAETQRTQERLEQVADRIVATIRGAMAETGERLAIWESAPALGPAADGDLLLLLGENSLAASPSSHLIYYPAAVPEPEADPSTFSVGELFEFSLGQKDQALENYQHLANSSDPAIRAGALLRMARVVRAKGRAEDVKGQGEEIRAIYSRLAAISSVRVAGAPADLVARHALAELSGSHTDAASLRDDLLRGRWHLTRGQFEFYWSETQRLYGRREDPPAAAVALAEVTAVAWDRRLRDADSRGQETVWIGDRPFFLIWRGRPERRAVLVVQAGSFFERTFAGERVLCAVVDADGRVLAGERSRSSHAAVRAAAESRLAWTLYVSATQPLGDSGLAARQRLLLAGIAVVVLFLVCGTYFIARAIRRETETLRMQSDFVSAVSHEFRSPLTSMRQLSEILALGRVHSPERRQLYYETLVNETSRLQRLIETLLNFGRMEAGVRQYRFEELDAALLVHRVISEFQSQIAGSGRRIEVDGPDSCCVIDADPDAISVVLRNLLDNALKYSPQHPVVWVEWSLDDRFVAIRVRDKGPGIAESERKMIFRKFVRGSAAANTNVKGSGVGLAMVRHIVAAHGGAVTVSSEPGQGSAFTVLLPLAGKV